MQGSRRVHHAFGPQPHPPRTADHRVEENCAVRQLMTATHGIGELQTEGAESLNVSAAAALLAEVVRQRSA